MSDQADGDTACASCTPHVCTPEFNEEHYCGWCGKDMHARDEPAQKGVPGYPYVLQIAHPMADTVSFFAEPRDSTAFEAAFFKDNQWVTDAIPTLEPYRDWFDGADTCVYRYVPAELLLSLIGEHALAR